MFLLFVVFLGWLLSGDLLFRVLPLFLGNDYYII